MWVKVCGVTNRESAEAAVEAGADAIGLNLMEGPRRVSVSKALEIASGLDVERVALIDVEDRDRAMKLLVDLEATGVQPYGRWAGRIAEAATEAGYLVLRSVPVSDEVDLSSVPLGQVPLLDGSHPVLRGGTGAVFDWSLAVDLDRPVVVAGGIGPDNVGDLIAEVQPWGVDASSRLESSPGRKDPELVRTYVLNAKQANLQP